MDQNIENDPDARARALYQRFVDRFLQSQWQTSPPPRRPVMPEEIQAAEEQLEIYFPASLTQFWLHQGAGQMGALMEHWFAHQRECPLPFERILPPGEIRDQFGLAWRATIPTALSGSQPIEGGVAWNFLVPIAVDSRGNWHCFPREENIEVDLPVYYFDKDRGTIEPVAKGFDALLEKYLESAG